MRVTQTQATKVLDGVKLSFSPWVEGGAMPQMVQDFDGADWAIIWEDGAPYDWPMLITGGVEEDFGFTINPVLMPSGVFGEPMNGCVLALYRT